MLKYVDTLIVFREIPDEITLAINISNCKIRCKGCHSKHLWRNIGTPLTTKELDSLIKEGITCVAFMGGEPKEIPFFAKYVKDKHKLKVAYYTGLATCPPEIFNNIQYFDYLKLGPYIEEYGPLDSPYTNQRLYQIGKVDSGFIPYNDITSKLWK